MIFHWLQEYQIVKNRVILTTDVSLFTIKTSNEVQWKSIGTRLGRHWKRLDLAEYQNCQILAILMSLVSHFDTIEIVELGPCFLASLIYETQ